jgi:dienelactone hydrolase
LVDREVRIAVDDGWLDATVRVPPHATGIVVFAHGSGSSRFSSRNRMVASTLERAGIATVLVDLLTAAEERFDAETGRLRFDIPLLASRVEAVMDWLAGQGTLRRLRIGLFGASTGAGAALLAAARWPERVGAIVSRGGRPDLAGAQLAHVTTPTLLIVGGNDREVLALNEQALRQLRGARKLIVVPGATHLFEEPGALDRVAIEATRWFHRYLDATGAGEAWSAGGW